MVNMRALVDKLFKDSLLIMSLILFLLLFLDGQYTSAFQKNQLTPDTIIFTDGVEKFEYTLKELGLVKTLELEEDSRFYYYLSSNNPTMLSYELYQLSKKVNLPPKNAHFFFDQENQISIQPEEEGRVLDLGNLIVQLANPGPYQSEYQLPFKKVEPQITTEELTTQVPDQLWATYSTVLANIPDRTENVRVGAERLNGLIIKPHAVVSFNEVIGPRDVESGFREAKIIIQGSFSPGLGGGICQVSSTLYNTVLLAGLDIKERHNHSVSISYVPLGRDATVVYGSKDLRFSNPTESYLLIKTKLEGLRLTISLYGRGEKPYSVSVYSKIIKKIVPQAVYLIDSSMKKGETRKIESGQNGYVTETYRLLWDGIEKKEERISRDYYVPLSHKIAVGL